MENRGVGSSTRIEPHIGSARTIKSPGADSVTVNARRVLMIRGATIVTAVSSQTTTSGIVRAMTDPEPPPSLTAQMRELETEMRDYNGFKASDMLPEWADQLAALTVQVERLEQEVAAIRQFADLHEGGCQFPHGGKCSCGWNFVEAEIEERQGGKPQRVEYLRNSVKFAYPDDEDRTNEALAALRGSYR